MYCFTQAEVGDLSRHEGSGVVCSSTVTAVGNAQFSNNARAKLAGSKA
jgi:hypothetical protein